MMVEQFKHFIFEQDRFPTSGFTFIFDGKLISSQQQLFDAFGNGMDAPNNYFGLNWNAFEDSLMDLQWLSEIRVNIVHESLPNLNDDEIKVYLEILESSILKWNNKKTLELQKQFPDFRPHRLAIYFQSNLHELISALSD